MGPVAPFWFIILNHLPGDSLQRDMSILTHLQERDEDPSLSLGNAQMPSFSGDQFVAFFLKGGNLQNSRS